MILRRKHQEQQRQIGTRSGQRQIASSNPNLNFPSHGTLVELLNTGKRDRINHISPSTMDYKTQLEVRQKLEKRKRISRSK